MQVPGAEFSAAVQAGSRSLLRLFAAIDLEEGVRGRIAEIQRRLRTVTPSARWVVPGNLHLTLRFVGETPEERLGEVEAALARTAGRHAPVELELAGVGAFPTPRRARVLWVGLRSGQEGLKRLVRDLNRELEKAGFEGEARPFSGHITLARIRRPAANPELERELGRSQAIRVGRLTAEEILLMRSVLRRSGPLYTCVGRYALTGERLPPR